jgi:acylphosphatase
VICFRVTGRVQGVSYRAWAVHTARALGLRGWVRNVEDGAVAGRADGDAPALAALREALHRGPAHARVVAVHVEMRAAPEALPSPFTRLDDAPAGSGDWPA